MSCDDPDMSCDDADLVEPAGAGAEWFDEPALFYLTHREQIERWYALHHRADEAANQYLLSFQDDLESIAEENGFQVGQFDGRFRCLLLWPQDGALNATGEPPIAAALRWHLDEMALNDQGRAPRVGVRVGRGSDKLCEEFLGCGHPDMRQLRQQHVYSAKAPRWPVFRDLPAEPQWWADLDGYRAQVVEAVADVIQRFGQCIRVVYPVH